MKPAILFVPLLWISLAAQVQVYPAQRPPLPPQDLTTGKASIEGTVIDAITHEPVKKASVILISRLGLSAVTDVSGHFAFRQLPAGQYGLQARSDKYPAMQDSLDTPQQVSISLAADEHKQDLTVQLTPGASVRGRIVDEEGNPMRCGVTAMQFHNMGTGRTLQQAGFSQSDEKGEYRISSLLRGKYYIQARCNQSVPLPHAFIRRTSTVDLPTLSYAPVFYPSAPDPASAARVQAAPGADISGIDFHVAAARGVTVRGRAGPAADHNMQITLEPKDSVAPNWGLHGAGVNASTGEFQIPNVLPGSYELVATASDEGRFYFAKVPVEVDSAPLEPIDLTLAVTPTISGSITIEGDMPQANVRLMLNPLDTRPIRGAQPQAEVQANGTFTFNSVVPGRWRLSMTSAPGYVKSLKQGDHDVSPWDFEIGLAATQLKVVIGTKYAQVEATLSAAPAGTEQISATVWAANGDPQFQQNFPLNLQGPSRMTVPPGRYYACAFQAAQPWMLMQNRDLRKALEGHCETVEASEDGTARVQVPIIPVADLKQLLEKIEE